MTLPFVLPDQNAFYIKATTQMADHEAASDPHAGYRLESADHTHQSTGLQAGQLDHGLALTGLTDDDHPQYVLETAVAFTTWTPTLNNITQGNGTITARYNVVEKLVHYWLHFSFGSTSSFTGTIDFSLPVTASSSYVTGEEMIGISYVRSAGTQHAGMARLLSTTTVQPLVLATAGAHATIVGVNATVPLTFATGDDVSISGWYEAA